MKSRCSIVGSGREVLMLTVSFTPPWRKGGSEGGREGGWMGGGGGGGGEREREREREEGR